VLYHSLRVTTDGQHYLYEHTKKRNELIENEDAYEYAHWSLDYLVLWSRRDYCGTRAFIDVAVFVPQNSKKCGWGAEE